MFTSKVSEQVIKQKDKIKAFLEKKKQFCIITK